MKAAYIVRHGDAAKAFEMREIPTPKPGNNEILVKCEGFGLNYADIMARTGLYQDAPPMPSLVGYDVCGHVEEVGKDVTSFRKGDRVVALTRFGGYAEYAIADQRAVYKIPGNMNVAEATSLATQYCTAYFNACIATQLFPGETVLVHAGAGGVGIGLIQIALHKKCIVIATGSSSKREFVNSLGVHHFIDYTKEDFAAKVKSITNSKGVDVIFDAIGGTSVKKGFKLLTSGGRIICYGASQLPSANIFGKIGALAGFGFYHPLEFMMSAKSLIGVNMLRIADDKPEMIQHCLAEVTKMYEQGIIKPITAKIFPAAEIAAAHEFLGSRKSIGKVACQW